MASVREMVEKKLEGIDQAVQELRDELDQGADFDKLTGSADQISEQADSLADKFQAIVKAMGDEEPDEALEADESKAEPKAKQDTKKR